MSKHPLLTVENLSRSYTSGAWLNKQIQRAVHDVSFEIMPGETLALVGESGSGKSTVGRLIACLDKADNGRITFAGQPISDLTPSQLRPLRRNLQIIFQDPYSAIDPHMTVGAFVAEPLLVHGVYTDPKEREHHVAELFRTVGLDPATLSRLARDFSGGQRQRLCIARAIALKPKLIVADEPITALDVSIQAQIINLLQALQAELGVSFLFISHDLSMVRHISHRVAVMHSGRIVELASTSNLFAAPRHPYTQALLSAMPIPDPRVERARQRIYFDPRQHPIADHATLHAVAPEHFILG